MEKDNSNDSKKRRGHRGKGVGMAKGAMQTHDQILLAAIQEFSTKGFAATTIEDIVKASGISKPALYYHFKNKEELFKAVLMEVHRRSMEWMDEIEKQDLDFKSLLREIVRLYQLIMQQHPSIARMMLFLKLEHKKTSPLWQFHRGLIQERIERFTKIIDKSTAKVRIKEGISVADIMKMLVGYIFISMVFDPDNPDFPTNAAFDESLPDHLAEIMAKAFLED